MITNKNSFIKYAMGGLALACCLMMPAQTKAASNDGAKTIIL